MLGATKVSLAITTNIALVTPYQPLGWEWGFKSRNCVTYSFNLHVEATKILGIQYRSSEAITATRRGKWGLKKETMSLIVPTYIEGPQKS